MQQSGQMMVMKPLWSNGGDEAIMIKWWWWSHYDKMVVMKALWSNGGDEAIMIKWWWLVCWSLTSLCHSNGHIETMPAREINPFTALTRIRSQFLRTQWSTSNHQRVDTTTPQTAEPSGLAQMVVMKPLWSNGGH